MIFLAEQPFKPHWADMFDFQASADRMPETEQTTGSQNKYLPVEESLTNQIKQYSYNDGKEAHKELP